MTADSHCPECGCDDRPIVLVRRGAVKRRCDRCGHVAWTTREEDGTLAELLLRRAVTS